MIRVDCTAIPQYVVELASHLGEKMGGGAIPLVKLGEIVFDVVSKSVILSPSQVGSLAESFLKTKSQGGFTVEVEGEKVRILSTRNERPGKRVPHLPPPNLFVCQHCGYVTPYEEKYIAHNKLHYLSGAILF